MASNVIAIRALLNIFLVVFCFCEHIYSFRTASKLKLHENVCKEYGYCHMIMPEEGSNILKYNQEKKTPFVIYVDKEFQLEKTHACDNNPQEYFTGKIRKHTASDY